MFAVDVMATINEPISVEGMKNLSKNKSRGRYGITSEFYQELFDQISLLLAAVVENIKSKKLLLPSIRCINFVLSPPKNPAITLHPMWKT